MKNRMFNLSAVLIPLVLGIWLAVNPVLSYEVAYDSGTNHYEWPTMCLYANDIHFNVSDVQALVENGNLDAEIVKNAQVQVRIPPSFQLQTQALLVGGITGFDRESIDAGVYTCTLYTSSNTEHNFININMYIKENVETQVKGETIEYKKENSETKENKYNSAGLLFGASLLIIIVQAIIAIPKIKILYWYSKK